MPDPFLVSEVMFNNAELEMIAPLATTPTVAVLKVTTLLVMPIMIVPVAILVPVIIAPFVKPSTEARDNVLVLVAAAVVTVDPVVELSTMEPLISPALVPLRMRAFEPMPLAVKLVVNLNKPEPLATIVALPEEPARLMILLLTSPVPMYDRFPETEVEPMLIVVPEPAALFIPRSLIEVTKTVPPLMLRIPEKELELLRRYQMPPLPDPDTPTLPPMVTSEIRPVITFVFKELVLMLCRARVLVPEADPELILPPMTNLPNPLEAWLLIVKPPYITSAELMVMTVLLAEMLFVIRMVELAVMNSEPPFVVPIV